MTFWQRFRALARNVNQCGNSGKYATRNTQAHAFVT